MPRPSHRAPRTAPPGRVRFVAGHLWALARKGDRVEVFSVEDPDAPIALGSFTTEAADTFREVWKGTRVYTWSGRLLQVKQVKQVQDSQP